MNFLRSFVANFGASHKKTRKSIKDYQQELLVKQTRDQFKKMMQFGQLPISVV